jgi:hypothetical protein
MYTVRSLPALLTALVSVVATSLSYVLVHYALNFPVSTSILIALVVAVATVRWRGRPE